MHILISLAVGALCGYLASQFMGSKSKGLIVYIILGIVGGALGNFLFGIIGISFHGIIGNVIGGVLGTCILIALGRFLLKK
ncbi:MAG: GlsB/YeaQ/YmgE family stress response membrane protein [Lachnospiraceae bacterium]|nr:GlsB/YeaQ/YmgE family stress response membrane protein [Lachnospiraceae bacterium]